MTSPAETTHHDIGNIATPWDRDVCLDLLQQLWALRTSILESELRFETSLEQTKPNQRASARNLIHYLALRGSDLRELQEQLSWLGVSSLGGAESHVLANVDKVIGILHQLTGQTWMDRSVEEPSGIKTGRRLLKSHSDQLLGLSKHDRKVRIMVTLPSEASHDYPLVKQLVASGMDIARINCAHDDAKAWKAMAKLVHRAAKTAHREVKILMDLGGPKIRTGPMEPGPRVLKLKPSRDKLGHPIGPSRLHIRADDQPAAIPGISHFIEMDADWISRLRIGKQIGLVDARGKKRQLLVVEVDATGVVVECLDTYYLTPDTALTCTGRHGHKIFTAYPNGIPAVPGVVRLHKGDLLEVGIEGLGSSDISADESRDIARITCTLPQVLKQVKPGERVWFDDGRIGGVIRDVEEAGLLIEIVVAHEGGANLMADKGINFPDSDLSLPALTEKDLTDLQTVVEVADMVGLSFAQTPEDVNSLIENLAGLGGNHVGVVLKIETIKGFENLPGLMLSAMAAPAAGVMIARGDLAVECGYERMAEVQEEILWCAEAAHMPVIWATQVLESLAKSGQPSRAEISDAGLGVRAECVMLNKGPYITQAIEMLDDILRRMESHHSKKKSLLRALHSWGEHEARHRDT